MQHWFYFLCAVFNGLGVMLGAFAAHALKPYFSEYQISIWTTAVNYQFIHALALGWVGVLSQNPNRWLSGAGILFSLGIIIFSGSLYLLALTQVKTWGAITPIGGTFFILGWIAIAISIGKGFFHA